uniref:SPOC domain-containing protein n=1 Tax=Caenorhabditis japonica TaxID=281687 RepID=A0A8R1IJD1_CAEJA
MSQNTLYEKLAGCNSKELSLGVITGKKDLEDLQPLVNYFTNKDAAVPGGVLYIFPFCEFALKLLAEFTPQVHVFNESCPFLLGALAVRAPGSP